VLGENRRSIAAGGRMTAARAVLQRHGRTFAFASHVLTREHADRAAVLYAFCRHVDDLADEAVDARAAHQALQAVRDGLMQQRSDDPTVRAFLHLQARTGLPTMAAVALIDGVISDLGVVRVDSERDLVRYAWRVAGTVGVMMCAVLDVRDPRATPFAIDLGIAMQLTNIARDVGADARMGRRYLPASWVGDVTPEAIAAPPAALQATLRDGTRRLLQLAESYYRSGESGLGFLPWRARLAIFAAARMYRAIGTQVAAAGYRSWDRRAALGAGAKGAYATQAAALFLVTRRLHRRDAEHDARLQQPLEAIDGRPG
jgi:phytoene synthase